MDKYINERVATLLLIPGAIISALSIVITIAMVFSAHNKVGSCFIDAAACDLSTEHVVSRVMLVVGIGGFMLMAAGMVLFIASRGKQRPKQ